MEGSGVVVLPTDLTPVLEEMTTLEILMEKILGAQLVMSGVVLGVMVIVVLAVMFRD